jgi:hypothetical protein
MTKRDDREGSGPSPNRFRFSIPMTFPPMFAVRSRHRWRFALRRSLVAVVIAMVQIPAMAPTVVRAGRPYMQTITLPDTTPMIQQDVATVPSAPGWDSGNIDAAFAPGNRRGTYPLDILTSAETRRGVKGTALTNDRGIGSANFQVAAPIVHLAGRNGLDLDLTLQYNSSVWQKLDASTISYNTDSDWPALGWSLGFGKLIGICGPGGNCGAGDATILVEPNGTRHSSVLLTSTLDWNTVNLTNTRQTTDGTYIDYSDIWSSADRLLGGTATYPDGHSVLFAAPNGNNEAFPIAITDADGNVMFMQYLNNMGPQLQYVSDTLDRALRFWYDPAGRLTTVSGPQFGGGAHALVRLHYAQAPFNPAHAFDKSITIVPTHPVPVSLLDAIYYPDTGTGYWFGNADSYSVYGMLGSVVEQIRMKFSAASWETEGTVTSGSTTHQWTYNYPLTPSALTDVPRYTSATEWWFGMEGPGAVTQYALTSDPGTGWSSTRVNYPDGSCSMQVAYANASGADAWKNGLAYEDAVYHSCPNGGDQTPPTTQTNYVWELGDYASPRVSLITRQDERGQAVSQRLSYAASPNQVTDESDLDYDGTTVLRRVHKDYVTDPGYGSSGTHIFGLPTLVEVFDKGDTLSRTDYGYDGYGNGDYLLNDTPGLVVVHHRQAYDPRSPVYDAKTKFRGAPDQRVDPCRYPWSRHHLGQSSV